MPEMPEVEIIRRGLRDKLLGRQVTNMEVFLPRLIKWPDPVIFQAMFIGRKISDLSRRGKYLLLQFDNQNEIVVHLRMTGRLFYVNAGAGRDAYARIVFHLDNGGLLVYADTRTLGTLHGLKPGERWRITGLAEMGPEPLSEPFTALYLTEVLAKTKGRIKSILLNQKYIGGLGNIYADECLYLAGIHPEKAGGALVADDIQRLYSAINEVIAAGINDGGTTFRDYRDGEGKKGGHQEHLFVYGRNGLPCRRCKTVIKKIVVGGRGTHFCPRCQG